MYAGHALGFWICGCSLFYKRELWASKSAGAHGTKSLKICRCKRLCPKDLRVRAPAAPVLTQSLLIVKTAPDRDKNNHLCQFAFMYNFIHWTVCISSIHDNLDLYDRT